MKSPSSNPEFTQAAAALATILTAASPMACAPGTGQVEQDQNPAVEAEQESQALREIKSVADSVATACKKNECETTVFLRPEGDLNSNEQLTCDKERRSCVHRIIERGRITEISAIEQKRGGIFAIIRQKIKRIKETLVIGRCEGATTTGGNNTESITRVPCDEFRDAKNYTDKLFPTIFKAE